MIKVNLAKRKSAVGSDSGKPLPGLAAFMARMETLKGLPLKTAALSVLVAVVASSAVSSYEADEIQKLDTEISKLSDAKGKLSVELAKSASYEEQKRALESDEKLIDQKIKVIQELTSDRASAPKLIFFVASMIPKEIWLTEIKLTRTEFRIKGNSLSYSPISDLLKGMSESEYFTEVVPEPSEQKTDESGREVFLFSLVGKRKAK